MWRRAQLNLLQNKRSACMIPVWSSWSQIRRNVVVVVVGAVVCFKIWKLVKRIYMHKILEPATPRRAKQGSAGPTRHCLHISSIVGLLGSLYFPNSMCHVIKWSVEEGFGILPFWPMCLQPG